MRLHFIFKTQQHDSLDESKTHTHTQTQSGMGEMPCWTILKCEYFEKQRQKVCIENLYKLMEIFRMHANLSNDLSCLIQKEKPIRVCFFPRDLIKTFYLFDGIWQCEHFGVFFSFLAHSFFHFFMFRKLVQFLLSFSLSRIIQFGCFVCLFLFCLLCFLGSKISFACSQHIEHSLRNLSDERC